ncbi:hypothetical protein SEVIR_2G069350v4 [Setaria viridis]|uniref:Uncharacterized protein n=1 Tax=Setaria viridis TaxID=4556 RepID=A0A4U6VMG5_SETVI|nr:hypothetical protein SEVIR_2G069350v2 [Setaria viridis]
MKQFLLRALALLSPFFLPPHRRSSLPCAAARPSLLPTPTILRSTPNRPSTAQIEPQAPPILIPPRGTGKRDSRGADLARPPPLPPPVPPFR